jgi:hypothetical protein
VCAEIIKEITDDHELKRMGDFSITDKSPLQGVIHSEAGKGECKV